MIIKERLVRIYRSVFNLFTYTYGMITLAFVLDSLNFILRDNATLLPIRTDYFIDIFRRLKFFTIFYACFRIIYKPTFV